MGLGKKSVSFCTALPLAGAGSAQRCLCIDIVVIRAENPFRVPSCSCIMGDEPAPPLAVRESIARFLSSDQFASAGHMRPVSTIFSLS